jgi:hypothetical protein
MMKSDDGGKKVGRIMLKLLITFCLIYSNNAHKRRWLTNMTRIW